MYITKPGIMKKLEVTGDGRDLGNGLVIRLPSRNDVLEIGSLCVTNACNALIIERGTLIVGDYIAWRTWGDSIRIHEHSRLHIEGFTLDDPDYRLSQHYDVYHVDRLIQGFSKTLAGGRVGDVVIERVNLRTTAKHDQAAIFSEGRDRYHDITIGSHELNIDMVHCEWFKATSVVNCFLGGGESDLKCRNGRPLIRIGDKDTPIKPTVYSSGNIHIASNIWHGGDVVPIHADVKLLSDARVLGTRAEFLKTIWLS